jgi:hypothetical protein
MHATIAKTNVSEIIKSAWKEKKSKNSPVIHKIISPWPKKKKEGDEYDDDENDSWMHPKRQNANARKV